MWESTAEKQFILDRRKADTHTQRSVRVSSLIRSVLKRELNHLQRTVILGLCFHLVSHLVLFPSLIRPRALPDMHAHLLAKVDFSEEAYG